MGKIPSARGFHRCLLIVRLNKLALGWRHEYFSEHRLSSFLFPLSCSFSSNLPQRGLRKAWYNMANQATESWEWFVNWIWEADSRHPGEGLSGSADHKDMEATTARFVSLCDQCYKASLVSLYFLGTFWYFIQKNKKNLKLLSCEEFAQTLERHACSQHRALLVLLCFYTLS